MRRKEQVAQTSTNRVEVKVESGLRLARLQVIAAVGLRHQLFSQKPVVLPINNKSSTERVLHISFFFLLLLLSSQIDDNPEKVVWRGQ